MPLTELHGLAERNGINKENIQKLIGDINTVNEKYKVISAGTPYVE